MRKLLSLETSHHYFNTEYVNKYGFYTIFKLKNPWIIVAYKKISYPIVKEIVSSQLKVLPTIWICNRFAISTVLFCENENLIE